MPAHDGDLTNFNGKSIDIDLDLLLLPGRLLRLITCCRQIKSDTRRLIRENLDRRIFQPYRNMVSGEREKNWWMTGTNNWNAVLPGGCDRFGAAVIDSPIDRGFLYCG
jgi:hypothetical protein